MKKILFLLSTCFSLTGCGWIVLGLAVASAPDPEFSFYAKGEKYESDDEPGTIRIVEMTDEGFALSYGEGLGGLESDNTLEGVEIGLNCGFFDGKLKKGMEYRYNSDDRMDFYPFFKHIYRDYIDSSPGSEAYRIHTIWYNATEGWIKITKLNKKKGIMSGRFEFTAVIDDPSSDNAIEITNGVFRDIPYIVVSDE